MTWFRVDDSLAFHQKVIAAGNTPMGLWLRAGAWAAHQLNDGVIPASMVKSLGGTITHARSLVSAGLWREEDGAFIFHDWEDYQPTSAEVKAARLLKSEIRAKAGRSGGLASGVSRKANAKQNEAKPKQNEAKGKQASNDCEAPSLPDPSRPVPTLPGEANPPTPSELPPPPKTPSRSKPKTRAPETFPPNPETAETCRLWAERRAPAVDLRSETEAWLDWHKAKGDTAADWLASWRTWMARSQKDAERGGYRPGGSTTGNNRQNHNDQLLQRVIEQTSAFGPEELSA